MASFKDMPTDKFVTAVGTAVYPHVHARDTRFDDPDEAKFKTELNLTQAEAKPILAKAKALIKKALRTGKASSDPQLPGEKEDDGSYTLKFKSAYRPALFDSEGQPLKAGIRIAGGTKMRISGTMKVYDGFGNTGVTLYMNAIQILDLKTFGESAEDFGFDAMEEGFTADDLNEDADPFSNAPDEFEDDFDEDDEDFPADF